MRVEVSKLEIRLRQRPGVTFPNGTYKSLRNYVDFLVDGESICERAASAGYDLVSVFAKEWIPQEREKSFRRLLLLDPAGLPNNRRSLLVCGECGDLGCGAVSVVIDIQENTVSWREFGYENNWENKIDFERLVDLGPFKFDLQEYKETLARALTLLKDS